MQMTFLILLAGTWLVSPILLLIALAVTRRRLAEARRQATSRQVQTGTPPVQPLAQTGDLRDRLAPVDLDDLLLLRKELTRQAANGRLSAERLQELTDQLDRLHERHLGSGGAVPDSPDWQRRRTRAWNLLARSMDNPPGPAPWFVVVSETPVVSAPPLAVPLDLADEDLELEPLALDATAFEPLVSPHSTQSKPPPRKKPATRPVQPLAQPVGQNHTWRPDAPSALEHAFRVISGWPRLIVPFLLQNIGWFVGAFCFISGALFLVANTSGFTNALVVFASLVSATAFLLWAGYRFRRQGDSLVVASSMLLTLAMLLAPLDLTVAVRLIDAAGGDPLLLGSSLGLTLITLAAFGWSAALSSGLMDRALRGRYPRLLTALAGMQLAAPLARIEPHWGLLAGLHAILLALLAHGLVTFSRDWLRRLFVDQRRTTYYAAGILVYTALVSGVQLTWNWPQPLPAGYSGPFLMALCALLFTVDAAFKEWVDKYSALTRFSFALYGLSAVAIAMALPSGWSIELTLAMGALLYGWVTRSYRKPPPLYQLLGCLAGLYGFAVLAGLPPAWHALASLPGLVLLLALARLAGRRSRAIALQCLGLGATLLLGLTAWSLLWPAPEWVGSATAASAALLIAQATRLALALPDPDPRWTLADAAVAALAALAVALAPAWLPGGWWIQTAFGWLVLSTGWTALGLLAPWPSPLGRRVWIDAALGTLALAVGLAVAGHWFGATGTLGPILVLALAALLTLWLAVGQRNQPLFYGVLALLGGIAMLVKAGYFPRPSSGLGEFLAVMALWPWLAWLGWRERRRQLLATALTGSVAARSGPMPLTDLVRVPLEQAMALLWAIGLLHLGLQLLAGGSPTLALVVVPAAMTSGLLVVGHFQLLHWLALPAVIGLAGLVVELIRLGSSSLWIGVSAAIYVLLVWLLGSSALRQPPLQRLARVAGFAAPGGRAQAEESLRGLALVVASLLVAGSPALVLLGTAVPEVIPALALSLAVFVLASQQTRSAALARAALATLVLAAWLVGHWLQPVALFGLGQPVTNTLLALSGALGALRLVSSPSSRLDHWLDPLRETSGLLYLLALGGAILGALVADPGLPLLLAALVVTLFPVTQLFPAWPGLGWLAVAALTASGALAAGLPDWRPRPLLLLVLWGNLLLLLARLWQTYGPGLTRRIGWRADALSDPLFWIPFGLLTLIALPLAWQASGWPLDWIGNPETDVRIALAALLLAAGAAHALWLRPGLAQAHLLILALTCLVGVVRLQLGLPAALLPLLLALWSAGLLLLGRARAAVNTLLLDACQPWLTALPIVAIVLLLLQPQPDWLVATLTLLILSGMALAQGWWQGQRHWIESAVWLAILATHTPWLIGSGRLDPGVLVGLAPWYGLQCVLIWLALGQVLARIGRYTADGMGTNEADRRDDLTAVLDRIRPRLLVLGAAWLLWHVWWLLAYLSGWSAGDWQFGLATDALAVDAALLILSGRCALAAWQRRDEPQWIYLTAVLLGLLAGYARLALFGFAPFTPLDTIALMAAAYLALLLLQLLGLQPFVRLAMLLPLLAIATTPLQLASTWAGGTLLAAGLLYLTLAARRRNPWPLYLGVLALNGAVYLWAPLWAERYGLWQFYLEPAAVSVLALIQLHRHELRPAVMNGTRLAALSLLYAGAGLDLFLRPELGIFVAALGLALLGVILGIALRIRAFLYTGLAFLVLNVLGQLVRVYPEQGMSRALILLALGAVITAGMVFFNLERESILRRVRILRADLAAWE